MDVSSTASGLFLRGLAREDVILPNAVLPALNTTRPLTETSRANLPSKLLPTGVVELKELTALTVIVVPAGSVVAFKDETRTQAHATKITAMTFLCFIRIVKFGFNRGFGKEARLLRSASLASAD